MIDQIDPHIGKCTNLGQSYDDGSTIIPFFPIDQSDYRPIAQAASAGLFAESPVLGLG
jgi:hypothetical protein